MDTLTRYQTRFVEVILDRSLEIRVDPKPEESEELDALWDSLTEEEKKDLQIWLKEQGKI